MRHATLISFIGILAALGMLLGILGYGSWLKITQWAELSRVEALAASIYSLLNELPVASNMVQMSSQQTEWRELSQAEHDSIVEMCVKRRPIAEFSPGELTGVLVDRWKHRYHISLRQNFVTGGYDVRVWSIGRDGINGTMDDLFSPGNCK